MYYTLIQHTGYSAGGNPQFSRAVELHSLSPRYARAALAAGGLVFATYEQAEEAEMAINYPLPEYQGLIPAAEGTFRPARAASHMHMLYVPTAADKERVDGAVTEIAA